ncbi:hypothetical protein QUV13_22605, partial [Xanthomonas citri pv. citri]
MNATAPAPRRAAAVSIQTAAPRPRRLAWALLLALAPALPGAAQEPPASVHPAQWPALKPPIPRDARLEARIQALLAKMSVEEKVGQI